jgi:geranylgeranyl reductase family protein
MNINIIGAGPAGNYSAYLLAKKGHKVNVFEKDPVIGSPVQCTGILSDYFLTLMKPDNAFVENIVEKTRIYAPNRRFIEAKIKKNYVICRKKFDNHLAELAKKEGAKFYLNHSFSGFERKGKKLISKINFKGKTEHFESDILIGADGPLSPVAKAAGLFNDRKFVIGTQIEARMKNDNAVEFYPYIGCYAWIVPKNKDVVRIGVAAYKNTPELFRKFAKEKLGKNFEKRIIENQSGVIPIFNPKVRAEKDNIYLIGDAATFVKATSGGGINQSLKAAGILCEAIENETSYERGWNKKLFLNLEMHLIIHKMMQKFSEEDWNELIRIFSEKKMKEILYDESRDKIVRMMLKVALTKPSLFKYVKYFPFEEMKSFF